MRPDQAAAHPPLPGHRHLSRKGLTLARREEIEGWLWISPWLVGLVLFTAGPILASLVLSFTRWNIVTPARWLGIGNYREIFLEDADFRQALKVTFIYAGITVPLHLVIGVLLSLLLNLKIRGINVYRTLFYLPSVLPGVVVALLWVWIFNPDFGLINWALSQFGVVGPRWFHSRVWALPGLMIMSFWSIGEGAVIYLAGLQNIPPHLYEAAQIDGATTWRQLWAITLPLLTPTIFFQLVMAIIGSLQAFVSSYVATAGGPVKATLFYMLYLYQNAFQNFRMGYASALAWILALLILAFTILVFKTSPLWVYYETQRRR